MGREYPVVVPWLRDRLGLHEFLHSATKYSHGTWYRANYSPAGSAREVVGFEGQDTIVLWCVRLIVTGNALCLRLYEEFTRLHDQKSHGKQSVEEWESLPVVVINRQGTCICGENWRAP
jgi:hypothetical protein